MIVSNKDESLGHGIEDAIEFAVFVRRSVEVPEIRKLRRVKPRFDVRKVTWPDGKTRPQRRHKLKNGVTVSSSCLGIGLKAEPIVVIAPDSDRAGFG